MRQNRLHPHRWHWVSPMIVIEGAGRTSDHRAELISATMQAIDNQDGHLSVVEMVGCLEIAKVLVINGPDDEE